MLTHHYQLRHAEQRDLLIELVQFSKSAEQKRSMMRNEKFTHPNDYRERTPDSIIMGIINGRKSSTGRDPNELKLLQNDRVVPLKMLLQKEIIQKRKSGLLNNDRRLWLTVGTGSIILSQ